MLKIIRLNSIFTLRPYRHNHFEEMFLITEISLIDLDPHLKKYDIVMTGNNKLFSQDLIKCII